MLFFVKKMVAPMFFPLPLCLAIITVGLILLWFTGRKKAGRNFATIGTILLILASYGPLTDLFLSRLERKYQPLLVNSASFSNVLHLEPPIKWVVVLGEGHVSDPELPATGQLSMMALDRLIEGIRLHREIPGSRLLLSGGRGVDPVSHADLLSIVARDLGVPEEEIVLEGTARDTEEEAAVIHSMIGDDRFVLVTSANHMPRSMALFRKAGMDPIPGPANQLAKTAQGFSTDRFIPSPRALANLDLALHEYFGLVWSRLRGTI